MNIFNNLRVYAGKWSVKETSNFTADATAATSSGEKAREDLRFHLPAYTLNELKILAISFHLCP